MQIIADYFNYELNRKRFLKRYFDFLLEAGYKHFRNNKKDIGWIKNGICYLTNKKVICVCDEMVDQKIEIFILKKINDELILDSIYGFDDYLKLLPVGENKEQFVFSYNDFKSCSKVCQKASELLKIHLSNFEITFLNNQKNG